MALSSLGVILFSLSGIVIGIFLFLKPALSIELQRRFYTKINWRLKPISLTKEIINTKVMGLFLVLVSISGIGYLLFLFLAYSSNAYDYISLPF